MELKYWRVSLVNGESLDVEAEKVMLDDKSNLIFRILQDGILQPVTVCNGGQWRAFRMIDKLEGEPLHSIGSPGFQLIVKHVPAMSQCYFWN